MWPCNSYGHGTGLWEECEIFHLLATKSPKHCMQKSMGHVAGDLNTGADRNTDRRSTAYRALEESKDSIKT